MFPPLNVISAQGLRALLTTLALFTDIALAPAQGYLNPPTYATGYIWVQPGNTVNTIITNNQSNPVNLNVFAGGAITTWNISMPSPTFDGQIIGIGCPGGNVGTINITAPLAFVQGGGLTSCTNGTGAAAYYQYSVAESEWLLLNVNGVGTVTSGTANDLAYYAATGTTVTGLPSANSGVLVTSGSGVPSISTTLPSGLAMGTPASLTLTNATNLPFTALQTGAEIYGLRVGGSTDDTRTCNIISGASSCVVSAVGDLQVGDDIRLNGAGAAYSSGAMSNLTATQGGTTGAQSITYYLATVDAAGGISAAQSVTIANGNATQTVDNPVSVSYTPPVNNLPAAVWKNTGSGDVFIGFSRVSISMSVTGGSGYTPGKYAWTATGGGCTVEPQGWVAVDATGALSSTYGKVETAYPGVGCTSAPAVAVPAGAGSGTGGAITLTLTGSFQDAGVVLPFTPEWAPSSHPASAQSDWMIATVGQITGTTLTLCSPGSYVASPYACTPINAQTTASAAPLRHSWTRGLATAIAAQNGGVTYNGASITALPCGTFEVETGIPVANTYTVVAGGSIGSANYCTKLIRAGLGNGFNVTGGNVTIQTLWLDGSNTAGGYAVSDILGGQLTVQWLRFNNNAGQIQTLGVNSTYQYNTQQCNNGWGQGYADYDYESTFAHVNPGVFLSNTYCNDLGGKSGNTRQTGTTRAGYRFDDVQTINASNYVAISDTEGRGYELLSTSGNNYGTGNGGRPLGVQFAHFDGIDAEFSALEDFYDAVSYGSVEAYGFLNGSRTQYEIRTRPGASLIWRGGRVGGSWLANVLFQGIEDSITNTEVSDGSVSSPGTYSGVELTASCLKCIVSNNSIGDVYTGNSLLYPVQLDSPPTATANGTISTSSSTITMATSYANNLSQGMTVTDTTTGQVLGEYLNWVGNTLYLYSNASHAGSGSSDVLQFSGGAISVEGNTFKSNVHNYLLDSSGDSSNNIGPNGGDAYGFRVNSFITATSASAPTIAANACGSTTQGTVTAGSTDLSGSFTVGTASVTTCTVTFALAHQVPPKSCQLTPMNSTAAATGTTAMYEAAPTTAGFTIGGSALAGAKYGYHCM